jgi:hypothetical protein
MISATALTVHFRFAAPEGPIHETAVPDGASAVAEAVSVMRPLTISTMALQ